LGNRHRKKSARQKQAKLKTKLKKKKGKKKKKNLPHRGEREDGVSGMSGVGVFVGGTGGANGKCEGGKPADS